MAAALCCARASSSVLCEVRVCVRARPLPRSQVRQYFLLEDTNKQAELATVLDRLQRHGVEVCGLVTRATQAGHCSTHARELTRTDRMAATARAAGRALKLRRALMASVEETWGCVVAEQAKNAMRNGSALIHCCCSTDGPRVMAVRLACAPGRFWAGKRPRVVIWSVPVP